MDEFRPYEAAPNGLLTWPLVLRCWRDVFSSSVPAMFSMRVCCRSSSSGLGSGGGNHAGTLSQYRARIASPSYSTHHKLCRARHRVPSHPTEPNPRSIGVATGWPHITRQCLQSASRQPSRVFEREIRCLTSARLFAPDARRPNLRVFPCIGTCRQAAFLERPKNVPILDETPTLEAPGRSGRVTGSHGPTVGSATGLSPMSGC